MTAVVLLAAPLVAFLILTWRLDRRARRRVERQLKLLSHPSCVQCQCATERFEFGPHTTSTYVTGDDL